MDVQTDALRWFQQVADGVTVTEVSEIERVTQSGVSRALARLETEVGTPLLRRSGRTLRMTRAGAAFKRHVDAMLHDLDDGLAAVSELMVPDTGTVAIAFQQSLGTWLVPDLIGSFRVNHGNVRFTLQQIQDEQISSVLQAGHVDLEISAIRPADAALRWRPLLREPLVAALPRGHRLAARDEIELEELAAEPFVCLRTSTVLRRQCDELCERAGFRPSVAFESDDLQTVRGFVAAGLGIAIVPAMRERSPEAERGSVVLVGLSDARAARVIGLVWSESRRLLPSAGLFRQHVIDRAKSGWLPTVVKPLTR